MIHWSYMLNVLLIPSPLVKLAMSLLPLEYIIVTPLSMSICIYHVASVHLPRIGHSTPHFNWYGTERLIRKYLVMRKIPTFMYPLNNKSFLIFYMHVCLYLKCVLYIGDFKVGNILSHIYSYVANHSSYSFVTFLNKPYQLLFCKTKSCL